jgi:hypothetical protein
MSASGRRRAQAKPSTGGVNRLRQKHSFVWGTAVKIESKHQK